MARVLALLAVALISYSYQLPVAKSAYVLELRTNATETIKLSVSLLGYNGDNNHKEASLVPNGTFHFQMPIITPNPDTHLQVIDRDFDITLHSSSYTRSWTFATKSTPSGYTLEILHRLACQEHFYGPECDFFCNDRSCLGIAKNYGNTAPPPTTTKPTTTTTSAPSTTVETLNNEKPALEVNAIDDTSFLLWTNFALIVLLVICLALFAILLFGRLRSAFQNIRNSLRNRGRQLPLLPEDMPAVYEYISPMKKEKDSTTDCKIVIDNTYSPSPISVESTTTETDYASITENSYARPLLDTNIYETI